MAQPDSRSLYKSQSCNCVETVRVPLPSPLCCFCALIISLLARHCQRVPLSLSCRSDGASITSNASVFLHRLHP